ncbi:MAG: T9SS type A sorting domain-containing protein [Bacteroidales bacterium]|nr:T9SS type A sorting domain-containing protein [Bacteroidales bacterium]MBQ4475841.1 T9SS type A sorting domain-containing protein [Bacteroidales bacterium]
MKRIFIALLLLVPAFAFAQRYHIGDTVYSPSNEKAVVFYVFDDGNHGWAVSLNDEQTTSFWSVAGNCITPGVQWNPNQPATDPIIPLYFPRIPISANTVYGYSPYMKNIEGWMITKELHDSADARYNDGAYGMYPVFYAGDFDDGWYIPTAGQMRKLYSSGILVKDVVIGLGGRWLKPWKYWTSTVANDSCPLTINGNSGRIIPTHINSSNYVRTIRNFGFVSDVTKDKYYCRGDKVADLGYDFYAENDTLISRTYRSYQGFDSIMRVNIHVLEPDYALAGNMLVCMGLNTEITVTHDAGTYNYAWKDELNPNETIGTGSSLTLENVTEGHPYSVTVGQYFEQVERFCSSSQSFDISVIETDVAISGGGIVCYNTSETLSVPDDDNLQYVWYQPSAPDNHLGTGSAFTTSNLTVPTAYAVSVSGGTCTGTGSITIDVAPEFTVSIGGDNSVCYGESANLVATPSSSDMVTYTWLNAENNEVLGTQSSISTANLYDNSQFSVNAVKTSGVSPSPDNVFVGDIVTSNNIVVRPSQWMEAEIQNLVAVGVVYSKNNDSVRVVGLDEYASIQWGASRFTTGQYANSYEIARTRMNGKAMTDALVAYNNSQSTPTEANYVAALKAREKGENWYLPAEGELYTLANNLSNVNYAISVAGGTEVDADSYYWSVTEKSADRAWASLGTGTQDDSKSTSHIVRPVTAFRYSDLISFRNSATCRASNTHTVAVTPQQIGSATATIGLGQSFSYRDSTITFSEAGDFDLRWTFHNNGGCDSIINIEVVVLPRTITVTPTANQHKNCGQTDPILQYSLSENIGSISGELSREAGESVGTYNYMLGTLDAGDNYELVLNQNSPQFEILPVYSEETISQCTSYDWNGTTYTSSGTYTRTLQTSSGCDSIVTLHLTIHSSDTIHIYDTACYTYTWQNNIYGSETYTESGSYTRRFYSYTTGCDSIVTLHLNIIGNTNIDIYEEACGYFEYNGYIYEQSNDYVSWHQSPHGCYYSETLHLTIYPAVTVPEVVSSPDTNCSGGSNGSIIVMSPVGDGYEYSIDGVNFQTNTTFTGLAEGTYTLTARNAICTNFTEVTVETTVVRPDAVVTASTSSVCNGETLILNSEGSSTGNGYSYLWIGPNGFTSTSAYVEIPNATSVNSGEYSLTIRNTQTGCDRTAPIYIAVNETTYGTDIQSVCDSFTWIDGNTYTESTDEPTFTLTNANGCDSIITLSLTISHSVSSSDEASICPGELPYEYHGEQFTEAGTFVVHLPAENGCDSIVTFTLNVYEGFHEIINVDVCEYEMPYIFDDSTLNEAGTYNFIYPYSPCDSVVTVVLNVHERPEVSVSQTTTGNEITLTADGASTYEWETGETMASITVEAANDTIWVIGYSEYQCADTTEVIINDLSFVGGIEVAIDVYPVPSSGTIFVEGNGVVSVELVDLNGKILRKISAESTITEISVDVPSGEYILRIETDNGILSRKILIAR